MKTIKQRFGCIQCNLIWEVVIFPYYPEQKKLRISFDVCPHCESDNLKKYKLDKEDL